MKVSGDMSPLDTRAGVWYSSLVVSFVRRKVFYNVDRYQDLISEVTKVGKNHAIQRVGTFLISNEETGYYELVLYSNMYSGKQLVQCYADTVEVGKEIHFYRIEYLRGENRIEVRKYSRKTAIDFYRSIDKPATPGLSLLEIEHLKTEYMKHPEISVKRLALKYGINRNELRTLIKNNFC